MLRTSVLLCTLLAIVSGDSNTQVNGVTSNPTSTAPVTAKTTSSAPVTSTKSTPVPAKTLPVVTEPLIGEWHYSDHNHTCIIVQFAVEMNVTYETVDQKTNYTILALPEANKTTVSGTCDSTNQSITISWKSSTSLNNNFTLDFYSANGTEVYALRHIHVALDSNDLPNITTTNTTDGFVRFQHDVEQYPTKKTNSYRCVRLQTLGLKRDNKTAGYIKIRYLQFQAFITTNTTNFSAAKDCPFDTPDYVPITVGCALAGLVVIVLIAYLVGRRRNQAHGYLSM